MLQEQPETPPPKHPQLAKLTPIISLQGEDLSQNKRKKVESWLQNDALGILTKQQRWQRSHSRIRQLQDSFQSYREEKIKNISEKLNKSQENKSKNIKSIKSKLRFISDRKQQLLSRIKLDSHSQLEQQLIQHNSFDTTPSNAPRSRLSSRQTNSPSRVKPQYSTLQKPQSSVQSKIVQINSRLSKAQSNSQERKDALRSKLHHHNEDQLKQAQIAAQELLDKKVANISKKIVHKFQSSSQAVQKIGQTQEQRMERKQKEYDYKLMMFKNNISTISSKEEEKANELNKKFESGRTGVKEWKNQRSEVYHQRFASNFALLEQLKAEKALRILAKHEEITKMNRVYQHRKALLFGTLQKKTN